jgi:IrrE N-terminal-like domain
MDELAAARDALGRFTATYGGQPPPVEVEELAESLLCLRVRVADDLCAVSGAPSGTPLSGLLLPARQEVWVSEHEPWARRRFSIAHEIGHFLLHAGEQPDGVFCRPADLRPDPDSPERLREREANRFAAELLMPEPMVRTEVERCGDPDPIVLAPRFAVSDVAMGWRLVNLGYLQALPVDLDRVWQEWQT